MYRKWELNEIEFIKVNQASLEIKEIAEKLNRTESSVSSMLHLLGINKKWSKEEDDILKEYYGKFLYDDYKDKLKNRTYSSVLNRATHLKLKSNRIYKKYKYDINHKFFNKVNNLNSYWAGFIAADGYIRKDTYCLGIKLSKNDMNHILNFKNDIKTETQLRFRTQKNKTGKVLEYSLLEVYSRDIIHDLFEKFNITPKKSLTIKPPKLMNFENKLSFIAGLIDGDGCIYKNKKSIRIYLVSGSINLLEWVKQTLNDIIDISENKLSLRGRTYTLNITNNKAIKLIKIITNLNIPILKRKWYKYELQ